MPKDPNKPKPSPSAYILYSKEARPLVQAAHPELNKKPTEIVKIIGAQWNDLSDAEKKPYYDEAKQLKEEWNAIHKPHPSPPKTKKTKKT